jgi:hypothetical protein
MVQSIVVFGNVAKAASAGIYGISVFRAGRAEHVAGVFVSLAGFVAAAARTFSAFFAGNAVEDVPASVGMILRFDIAVDIRISAVLTNVRNMSVILAGGIGNDLPVIVF